MPTPPSSGAASTQPPLKPEQRVLARAVGVWWVQRLLEAARARRSARKRREEGDLPPPEPAPR
jgi:hypothetical protein